MCWARTAKRPVDEPKTESSFTDEEKRNYADAVRLLKRKVIATAVMIGESKLEGLDRGVAEVRLCMVIEQSSCEAFVNPRDRWEALRWFNWSVELINSTLTALGKPILVYQAGFQRKLVEGVHGW